MEGVGQLRKCERLRYCSNEPVAALEFVTSGVVRLDFDFQSNVLPLRNLMRKYRDQPMDLADACLVRMAEFEQRLLIVTTDEDLKINQHSGREVVPHVLRTWLIQSVCRPARHRAEREKLQRLEPPPQLDLFG